MFYIRVICICLTKFKKNISFYWACKKEASMRRKIIIILVLFLVLLLCGVGYYYYFIFSKTPTYTFAQINKAYETHDVELFKKYVDVDSFCEQTVDDFVAWISQSDFADTGTDVWSELGNSIAKGMIGLMKPQMVSEMKKGLLDSVESNSVESSSSHTYSLKATINSLSNLQSFINGNSVLTVKDGKITTLKLTIHDDEYNSDLELYLLLKENGNHLQVVKISNLLDYLTNIDKLKGERISAINAKVTSEMENTLSISNVNYGWTEPDAYTILVAVTLSANFKNNGSKTIDKFVLTLTLNDSSGNKITDINFDESKIIKPNSVITVKVDKKFDIYDSNEKQELDLLRKGNITYEVKYTSIHFTDGSELKLHTKYE